MIKEISFKNYRTWKDVELKFDNSDNIISLIGEVGAGKSNLIEGILYGLYDKSRTKNVKTLGSENEDLIVGIKMDELSVERIDGNSTQHIIVNDVKTSKKSEAKEKIEQLIGCDYEVFKNTFFFQQSESDALMKKLPANRIKFLSDMFKLDEYEKYKIEAKRQTDELKNSIKNLTDNIENVEKEISEIGKDESELKSEIKELEDERKKQQKELFVIEKRLSDIVDETEYEELKKQYVEIQSELDDYSDEDIESADKYDFEENRKKLSKRKVEIEDVKEKIINYEKKSNENHKDIQSVKIELTRIKTELKNAEKEYESLKKTEGKCDKCGALSKNYDSDLKERKRIYDGFYSKQNNKQEELSGLEIKGSGIIEKLNDLNEEYSSYKSDVNKYKKYKTIIGLKEKQSELIKKGYTEEFENIVIEKNKLEQSKEKTESNLSQIERRIVSKKTNIELIKSNNKKLKEYRKSLKESKDDYFDLMIVQKMFDRKGLPQYIIGQKIIPIWEFEANNWYAKLDKDHEIKIEINSDNELEIYGKSSKGKKEFLDFCGGERVKFIVSIRIALTEMLRDFYGIKFSVLFLDEVFGAFDNKSRDNMSLVVNELSKTFSQIFIISHNDDQDRFSKHLRIEKNEEGYSEISA